MVWGDFMGLLDGKERGIVVLLRSGTTNLAEIGQVLGYASHSPVSNGCSGPRQAQSLVIQGLTLLFAQHVDTNTIWEYAV